MSKTAIVVLSDPNAGEEALGRLYNALAAAHDFKQRRQEVRIVFQGAGTRWAGVVGKPDHPAHDLYERVRDCIVGASRTCAVVFGAREAAEENGLPLLGNNEVPGTEGLASVAQWVADGYIVVTF